MNVLFDGSALLEELHQQELMRSAPQASVSAASFELVIHLKRIFLNANPLISTSVLVNNLVLVVVVHIHSACILAFSQAN